MKTRVKPMIKAWTMAQNHSEPGPRNAIPSVLMIFNPADPSTGAPGTGAFTDSIGCGRRASSLCRGTVVRGVSPLEGGHRGRGDSRYLRSTLSLIHISEPTR